MRPKIISRAKGKLKVVGPRCQPEAGSAGWQWLKRNVSELGREIPCDTQREVLEGVKICVHLWIPEGWGREDATAHVGVGVSMCVWTSVYMCVCMCACVRPGKDDKCKWNDVRGRFILQGSMRDQGDGWWRKGEKVERTTPSVLVLTYMLHLGTPSLDFIHDLSASVVVCSCLSASYPHPKVQV